MLITRANQMREDDLAAAQHFFSPFSSLFFGVKFLYDYGRVLTPKESYISRGPSFSYMHSLLR
jgi:hypothetical protein